MTKVQKPCKICGKMFTPCADCERDKTIFHWRTVACSLECAKTYFAKVEEARKPVQKINDSVNTKVNNEEVVSVDNETIVMENPIKQKKSKKYNDLKNEEESEQIE